MRQSKSTEEAAGCQSRQSAVVFIPPRPPLSRTTSMRLRNSFARRWKLRQPFCWPDRPLHKFSAAVRAVPAGQPVVAAIGTESAFERADDGILSIRWQVLVAALTLGLRISITLLLEFSLYIFSGLSSGVAPFVRRIRWRSKTHFALRLVH